MDKIQEDIKEIEKDMSEIKCNPIIKFFQDCYKCFLDVIKIF